MHYFDALTCSSIRSARSCINFISKLTLLFGLVNPLLSWSMSQKGSSISGDKRQSIKNRLNTNSASKALCAMLTEHVADVAVSRLRKRKPTMSQNNIDLNTLRTKAIAEAVALFEGDQKAAKHWLSTPVRGLGRRKPNDLLATREGIQQVRDIIGRLEHGVFS